VYLIFNLKANGLSLIYYLPMESFPANGAVEYFSVLVTRAVPKEVVQARKAFTALVASKNISLKKRLILIIENIKH